MTDKAEAQLAELLSKAVVVHKAIDSESHFCQICQLQIYSSTMSREQHPGHAPDCPVPRLEEVAKDWVRREIADKLYQALKVANDNLDEEWIERSEERQIEEALKAYESDPLVRRRGL